MGVGSSTPKAQQSETINWDNIETDKFSSSMSNFNGLSKDAKTLIASLNIPVITESDISDVNLNNILDKINNKLDKNDQYKFNKLLENVSYDSDNLSETSPFISSDMYNYLVNSNMSDSDKVKQTGGSKKSKSKSKTKSKSNTKSKYNSKSKSKKKGGAESVDNSVDNLVDDSSDTTTTSSASSLSDILDSSDDNKDKKKNLDKNKNKHRKDVKHHKYEKHHKDEKKENVVNDDDDDDDSKASVSNSELSGGELSYISSSAHTGGEFSDSSNSNSKSNSYSSSSSVQATVTNENTNVSMSVRTDDINLVSDY